MRLIAALLAVLTLIAGPVAAAASRTADCDHASTVGVAVQAGMAAPCPMRAMADGARPARPDPGANHRRFTLSCAQACAMAGAACVQVTGSSLTARLDRERVDYGLAGAAAPPSMTPAAPEHPPKAIV